MGSPWFVHGPVRNESAGGRLFCFPFAGGSGHEFRTWGEQFPELELFGVMYPGRGSRYTTPALESMDEMVAALQDELVPYQDKPFAFFGHSLGALIAFELARALRRENSAGPKLLCVSACDAPHLLPVPPLIHALPEADFIQAIRAFGGTPDEVWGHRELVAMMLPFLRADLKLLETYHYQQEPPLNIPLYAAGGSADTVVARENLLAWQRYTTAHWESRFFNGGHFFIRQAENQSFFAYLRQALTSTMP